MLHVKKKESLIMRTELLFWRKLSSELKKIEFETNSYDQCVASKEIDERC
jgi:hypothetical protein